MSLSEEVRAELSAIEPQRACCRLAELSALARLSSVPSPQGAGSYSELELGSPSVARRAYSLFRGFGVPCRVLPLRQPAFEQAMRFRLEISDDPRALQTLNEAGILDTSLNHLDRPPKRIIGRPCCRSAYLRGAMLVGGSVSGPRHPHLEFRTGTVESARLLAEIASGDGFSLSARGRRHHAIAYAKGLETITDLLAFLGAQGAALRLGESSVVSATRGHANRLANADHANIKRASRAAGAQIRAIRRLEACGKLVELAPELQELAELRVNNPTLSLAELAHMCRNPVSKSAVHRRLRKLNRLARVASQAGPEGGAPRTTSPSG